MYHATKYLTDFRSLFITFRFLKHNKENGEWEDVGDEIAREKASQVLRDAVGSHVGLPFVGKICGTKQSRGPESSGADGFTRFESDSRHPRASSALAQMRHGSPDSRQGVAAASWQTPSLSHPGGPISARDVPGYLPVTPQLSNTRKRQRTFETPDPFEAYSSAAMVAMNTPPARHYYRLPQPRPHVNFPAPSPSPLDHNAVCRVTDSRSRPFYPPSGTGTSAALCLLDDPQAPHDFDLFNGELLSDQSDRDGAASPFLPHAHGRRDRHGTN
jgi:hypothetical protein